MMNFLSNILRLVQVRDETTVNMNVVDNDCASATYVNSNVSKFCQNNSIISEDNSSVCDFHLSQSFSEQSECIEVLSQLNNSNEMELIDFEELIDRSRQLEAKTKLENISASENTITSDQTTEINNNNSVLSLDEIKDDLKTNTGDSINLDTQYKENFDIKENHINLLKHSNTCNIITLQKNNHIEYIDNSYDFENHNTCDIENNDLLENKNNILLDDNSIDSTFIRESKEHHLRTSTPTNDRITDRNIHDGIETTSNIYTKKNLFLNDVSIDAISLEEAKEHHLRTSTPTNDGIQDGNILDGIETTLNVDSKENLLLNNDAISIEESKEKYLRTSTPHINEMQDIDDNDGYNSSDFEFITENEAKMDLYGINFINEANAENISTTKSENKKSINSQVYNNSYLSLQGNNNVQAIDPGEGPSGLNRQMEAYDQGYRENHLVPEGNDYLDLFQGQYNPVLPLSDIIFLENKSTRPLPMNAQYEGIGFDLRLMRQGNEPDSSEEEYADEAKESINRILLEYPGENRKRRRF